MPPRACVFCVFFFNDTATTEIYTLSLHDALPISFLGGNSHRQELEGQTISHAKGVVSVAPFILPPVGSLSLDELEMAGGSEGLRGTQGFYVYRGRRLVIWGTWFGLVPKQEFYKLTRVQVDIPNSFDEL